MYERHLLQVVYFQNEPFNHRDHVLVADLINLYTEVFPENPKEMEQEKMMLQVLKKYSNQPHGNLNNVKVSGEFRVWIYLHNKKGETYNIAIGPQKTAYEICCELASKINLPVHELILEELVLNENLIRPIHYTEKVLDIVLKWGYWDDADRKDNCLILSPLEKYNIYMSDATRPIEGELRFADCKSRNFRAFMFAVSHGNLSCYKDKMCKQLFTSWKIEDIVWYLGNESKRSPPSKHTITFISKDAKTIRSKSSPWFGNVLAFSDEAFKALWIGIMWKTAHPRDFLPPAQHINIMNT
ncbi:rho gtpase activating protein at 15b isoform c [Holotrichia oblita]|uniref:Rho gtpase activating protein at 15b isoform c n=1 Tax=Holotrichia oblita TaxID=644536 RepID=A0ACB9TWM1_HOLOL|nr:rho gtpase activating protein at 15b isoform c [Holotrichia oblita]